MVRTWSTTTFTFIPDCAGRQKRQTGKHNSAPASAFPPLAPPIPTFDLISSFISLL